MASITTRVIRRAKGMGAEVYNRRQWGNTSLVYAVRRKTKPHKLIPEKPSDTVIQHITVTYDNAGVDGFKKAMRTLHQIGMERFGSGVSYNFAISMRTGRIGLGNSLDAKGTHTVNDKNVPNYSYDQNAVGVGIAFIGMPGDRLSAKALKAASILIAAMIKEGALTRGHDYVPHSLFAYKDCPTDEVREHMNTINAQAKVLAREKQV